MVVPFPDTKAKKRSGNAPIVSEDKQLGFVNYARDAVNQAGLLHKESAKGKPNYMAHLDDFVPLLERDEYKMMLEVKIFSVLGKESSEFKILIEDDDARAEKENEKNNNPKNIFNTPSSSRMKMELIRGREQPMEAKEALRKFTLFNCYHI
jgi:hypothetical protein